MRKPGIRSLKAIINDWYEEVAGWEGNLEPKDRSGYRDACNEDKAKLLAAIKELEEFRQIQNARLGLLKKMNDECF